MSTQTKMQFLMHVLFIAGILLLSIVVFPEELFAQSTDALMGIVAKVQTLSQAWNNTLQKAALGLFSLCLTLTVVMFGVKAALNRTNIADLLSQFIVTLIFCGFIAAAIVNYIPWTKSVIDGLGSLAGSAGASSYDAGAPLQAGLDVVKSLWGTLSGDGGLIDRGSVKNGFNVGPILLIGICSLIVLIVFALLTAQVILIKCESYIAVSAAVVLLGLGGADFMKEYAINVMRYVLSVGVKLYTMQLVMSLGMQLFKELQSQVQSANSPGLAEGFIYIATAIIIYAIAQNVPSLVAGIVNGSHTTSGASLSSAVAGAAGATIGGAVGAASGAMGAAGGVEATRKAAQMANLDGASGLGKVGHMAGSLWQAHKQAKAEGGGLSHGERFGAAMSSKLQEMKMRNLGLPSDGSSAGGKDGGGNGQA